MSFFLYGFFFGVFIGFLGGLSYAIISNRKRDEFMMLHKLDDLHKEINDIKHILEQHTESKNTDLPTMRL